jgi:hypothetical protein
MVKRACDEVRKAVRKQLAAPTCFFRIARALDVRQEPSRKTVKLGAQ